MALDWTVLDAHHSGGAVPVFHRIPCLFSPESIRAKHQRAEVQELYKLPLRMSTTPPVNRVGRMALCGSRTRSVSFLIFRCCILHCVGSVTLSGKCRRQ